MLPGPVFNVELLTTARRLRYYVTRVIFGALLLFLIWTNYAALGRYRDGPITRQEISVFANTCFGSMVALQVGAVLAITPSLVAGVIANEKQRKTLHYLLASRLSSGEIVLGKLLARMLHIAVLLAVALPIISLLSLFGGVDPVQVVLAFGVSLSIAFLLAAISILFSTLCKRVREAVIASYTVELFWLFLPLVVKGMISYSHPEFYALIRPVNDCLYAATPWAGIEAMSRSYGSQGGYFWPILGMMGLQILAGSGLVAVAVRRLRPTFRNQEGSSGIRLLGVRFRSPGRFRIAARKPVSDDAMLWKEMHTSRGSGWGQILWTGLRAIAFVGVGFWAVYFCLNCWGEMSTGSSFATTRHRQEFNGYLRFMTTCVAMISCLLAAMGGANSLTSEREEDTWISLISTPLEGSDIVRSKIVGVIWKLRPFFFLLVFLWVLGVISGAVHPVAIFIQAIEIGIFVGFSAALGTFFSLKSKSAWKSQTITIAVLVLLNGGYLLLCCPLMMGPGNSGMTVILAGVTPFIEAISLFQSGELDGSRPDGPRAETVGMVIACIVGTGGYLIGGLSLMGATIERFDSAAERPKRGVSYVPSKKQKPPDPHPLA